MSDPKETEDAGASVGPTTEDNTIVTIGDEVYRFILGHGWRREEPSPMWVPSSQDAGLHRIAELQAEIKRLRRWKAEATEVLKGWYDLADRTLSHAKLGESKSKAMADEIERLRGELSKYEKATILWPQKDDDPFPLEFPDD